MSNAQEKRPSVEGLGVLERIRRLEQTMLAHDREQAQRGHYTRDEIQQQIRRYTHGPEFNVRRPDPARMIRVEQARVNRDLRERAQRQAPDMPRAHDDPSSFERLGVPARSKRMEKAMHDRILRERALERELQLAREMPRRHDEITSFERLGVPARSKRIEKAMHDRIMRERAQERDREMARGMPRAHDDPSSFERLGVPARSRRMERAMYDRIQYERALEQARALEKMSRSRRPDSIQVVYYGPENRPEDYESVDEYEANYGRAEIDDAGAISYNQRRYNVVERWRT